jgi:hypothetical protein
VPSDATGWAAPAATAWDPAAPGPATYDVGPWPGAWGTPAAPTAPAPWGAPAPAGTPWVPPWGLRPGTPPPGWSVPPRRARRRHAADAFPDWCELLLVHLHLRLGRTAQAEARLAAMAYPDRAPTLRLGAARAQAAVATRQGDHERGHHLLNTAASLAQQLPSRFQAGLVERDRAVLLARQGRLDEGLALGERLLPALVRPLAGPHQRWSRHEGATLAVALARLAAHGGDDGSAARFLEAAVGAAGPLHDPVLEGHLHLSRGALRALGNDQAGAEEDLSRAAAVFEHTGDRVAIAEVALERARLAHRHGLGRSARPLYEFAAAELAACGCTLEARQAQRQLADLTQGRPLGGGPPDERGELPRYGTVS